MNRDKTDNSFGTLLKQIMTKAKAEREINCYECHDFEELSLKIFSALETTKELDKYAYRRVDKKTVRWFRDMSVEELWGVAKERAKVAEEQGGLLMCGQCDTPIECYIQVGSGYIKLPCTCKHRMIEYAEERKKRNEQERAERIEQNRIGGIEDSKLREFTFANDDGTNEKATKFAKNYCQSLLGGDIDRTGVIFYGTVGTGKTYMALAIANELISHGWFVHATNLNIMLGNLWDTQDKLDYIKKLKQFDMVVIDDLGAEHRSKTGYELDKLSEVIDELERANILLVVTSNETLDTFKNPHSQQEARAYDRLLRMCQLHYEMNGKSRRTQEVRDNYTKYKELQDKWTQ